MRRFSFLSFFFLVACGSSAPQTVTPDDAIAPRVAAALRMEEIPTAEEDTPRSRVSLVVIRDDAPTQVNNLGEHEGICSYVEVEDPTLFGARCWWAGAQTVVTIERRGDELICTANDSRNDEGLVEIKRVSIPSGADIQTIR